MLHSMDSMEYAQWRAFERANGPINGEWDSSALAAIQEQLQQLSYLLGQAHFTDKTHKRGPIPKPERYPRPNESFGKQISSRIVEFEDVDEEEWLPLTEDELVEVRYEDDGSEGE
jgi:hypothetical protein